MRFAWIPLAAILGLALTGCSDNTKYLPKPRLPDDDEPPTPIASAAPTMPAAPATTPPIVAAPKASSPPVTTGASAPGATKVPPSREAAHLIAPIAASPATPTAPIVAKKDRLSEVERRQVLVTRLQRISLAFEAYRNRNGGYPAPAVVTGAGHKLSWRVVLLPLLGRTDLYSKYRLNEPWDSAANRLLLSEIPDVYQSVEREDEKTNLLLVTGPGTLFPTASTTVDEDQVVDGLAATVVLVEVADGVARPWTQPDDYVFTPETCQQDLFGLRRDCCYIVLGGGGGPRRLPADIADGNLAGLLSPAGGERLQVDQLAEQPRTEVDQPLIEHLEKYPVARFVAAGTPATPAALSNAANAAARAATMAKAPNATVNLSTAPTPTARVVAKPAAIPLAAVGSPIPGRAPATGAHGTGPADDPRWPVPGDADLAAASDQVRDLFGPEYDQAKRAKTPTERRDFAKKMLAEAEKVGADPAGNYVLLRTAREVASRAQDLGTALTACERMAKRFRVDEVTIKTELLEQVSPQLKDDADFDRLYKEGLRLGDLALAKDDFPRARSLYRLAMSAVRRAEEGRGPTPNVRDPASGKRKDQKDDRESIVAAREEQLRETRQAHTRVGAHLHTMLRSADDVAANTAVGRYFCLIKRDWQRGLPLLVRGQDESLVALARRELAGPTQPDEQVALADAWWDYSDKATVSLEKQNGRLRALHWYRQSLSKLEPSLTRVRAEKRIAEAGLIEKELGVASPSAPTPQTQSPLFNTSTDE